MRPSAADRRKQSRCFSVRQLFPPGSRATPYSTVRNSVVKCAGQSIKHQTSNMKRPNRTAQGKLYRYGSSIDSHSVHSWTTLQLCFSTQYPGTCTRVQQYTHDQDSIHDSIDSTLGTRVRTGSPRRRAGCASERVRHLVGPAPLPFKGV